MTVNMMEDESLTVTELNANTNVDDLISDQYLAAELDEVIRLQNYAKTLWMAIRMIEINSCDAAEQTAFNKKVTPFRTTEPIS
ncbi:hypothetical protein M3Y96_00525000 [Aphelenchoides besseyi]|nr:hypothetical protein M3Y96_00525000 [Aphelenchoides besseyi]